MVLTALSALARIGVDPWQEAASLTLLPTDVAARRLTTLISGLPSGCWAKSDAGTIAARLIALLPAPKASQPPSPGTVRGKRPLSHRLAIFAFFLALNMAVFYVLGGRHSSPVIDNSDSATSTTETQPGAPLFAPNNSGSARGSDRALPTSDQR